jgi:hypothetical protein
MSHATILLVVLVFVAIFLAWRIWFAKSFNSPFDPPKKYDNINVGKEDYRPVQLFQSVEGERKPDFSIFNYLLKSVRLAFTDPQGKKVGKGIVIPARAHKTLGRDWFEKHFSSGNKIGIWYFDPKKPGLGETHFGDYQTNTPDAVIKGFHIGQITSRSVGASTDLTIGRPANATDGMPYIKIENMTPNFLVLNESINIGPGGFLRYTGRDHYGVRLGTVLRDTNSVFPDYIIKEPLDFIYYGVVSDIPQPLFGGWQLSEDLELETTLTKYPLQQGFGGLSGGPAIPLVDPLFLPIQGPPVEPKNRWGI